MTTDDRAQPRPQNEEFSANDRSATEAISLLNEIDGWSQLEPEQQLALLEIMRICIEAGKEAEKESAREEAKILRSALARIAYSNAQNSQDALAMRNIAMEIIFDKTPGAAPR